MARGPALDLEAHIDRRVSAEPGNVWTPVDFVDLGSRAAVDKSLQRLTANRKLSRIARGLYYRTGTNTLSGNPRHPTYEQSSMQSRGETRVASWSTA